MEQKTTFSGGINIALKIPKYKYDETVAFYRDVLKLKVTEKSIDIPTISRMHSVEYGSNVLWLDCVDNYTQPEIWLELITPNTKKAKEYLQSSNVTTKNEFEQIPEDKHWITDPAGNVLLLTEPHS